MRAHVANAFRRGDQVHHPHMFDSQLRQQIHSGDRAAAGGQHRVNQDDLEPAQVRRQTLVVRRCPQCRFLPFQPDESDTGMRDELQDRVQHAQARAQDRHEHDLAPEPDIRGPWPAG